MKRSLFSTGITTFFIFFCSSVVSLTDKDIQEFLYFKHQEIPGLREYQDAFIQQMLYNAQQERNIHNALTRSQVVTEYWIPDGPSWKPVTP